MPIEGTVVALQDTGVLLVHTYTCTGVLPDTATFDWFAECDPTGGVHSFTLVEVGQEATTPMSVESAASGDATFESLAPGLYNLEIVDAEWCHALSDNVNADGHVAIKPAGRTTVWGFICDESTPE